MTQEMKISEFLIQSKAIISDPDKWTQQAEARNKDGNSVKAYNTNAVCFCSLGAMCRIIVYAQINPFIYFKAEELLSKEMDSSIVIYNDNHTHTEVMAAWDRAIAAAKAKEER